MGRGSSLGVRVDVNEELKNIFFGGSGGQVGGGGGRVDGVGGVGWM